MKRFVIIDYHEPILDFSAGSLEGVPADLKDTNIDVFVNLDEGSLPTLVVGTPKNLDWIMANNDQDYVGGLPEIYVQEVTRKNIEAVMATYATQDEGYWIKLYGVLGCLELDWVNLIRDQHALRVGDESKVLIYEGEIKDEKMELGRLQVRRVFAEPAWQVEGLQEDFIFVEIELEDGYLYSVPVCTSRFLIHWQDQATEEYLPPFLPPIILRELKLEYLLEALNRDYCNDGASLLKQFALAKYLTVEMMDQRLKEMDF